MEHYDFSVHRGETFRVPVYLKNADGSAMDLTGREGYAQVRAYPKRCPADTAETVCEMTVMIDGTAGEILLVIPAEVTRALTADRYAYDLCLREEDAVRYYLGGAFTVLPSVTESGCAADEGGE